MIAAAIARNRLQRQSRAARGNLTARNAFDAGTEQFGNAIGWSRVLASR